MFLNILKKYLKFHDKITLKLYRLHFYVKIGVLTNCLSRLNKNLNNLT